MSRRCITTAASQSAEAGQIRYRIVRSTRPRAAREVKSDSAIALDQLRRSRPGSPRLPRATNAGRSTPIAKRAAETEEDGDLTQDAFDKLLAILDQDRNAAGRKYEIIRRKLQKFFECRGCAIPNDLADEAINLVARKVAQGQQITGDEPARYFYGVARNVIREYWRRLSRCRQSTECLSSTYHPGEDPAETAQRRIERHISDQRLERLEVCLRALTDENREVIIKYYDCEGSSKISGRRMLARQMGLHSTALRLRVHRIKMKLKRDLDEPA
jgi:DNA-directed RNA polymerase specialized sigma24 family protein